MGTQLADRDRPSGRFLVQLQAALHPDVWRDTEARLTTSATFRLLLRDLEIAWASRSRVRVTLTFNKQALNGWFHLDPHGLDFVVQSTGTIYDVIPVNLRTLTFLDR